MGPPGVPKVPILGPNRGMFSKLNWPGPLGSGGHSHTIFSNGRFQGAQRSFGGDVQWYCMLTFLADMAGDPPSSGAFEEDLR